MQKLLAKIETIIFAVIIAAVVAVGVYKLAVVGGYFFNEGREYHGQFEE